MSIMKQQQTKDVSLHAGVAENRAKIQHMQATCTNSKIKTMEQKLNNNYHELQINLFTQIQAQPEYKHPLKDLTLNQLRYIAVYTIRTQAC